jgi:uncharacterized phiE125 gp8 family phage protein
MISYNLIKDFKITADLVAEPVDLATARNWLRVKEFTTDDDLINSLITSVRLKLEKISGLSFGYKTMTCLLEVNDSYQWIDLPYGPVDTIDSVEQRDSASSWDALVETTSTVSGDYELFGSANSQVKLNSCGLFRFVYKGGFSQLPEDLLHDMKVLISYYYENRGHVMKGEEGNADVFPSDMNLNAYKYRKNVI